MCYNTLEIQCNAHQNSNEIIHRRRTNVLKFQWKHKDPRNTKNKSGAITYFQVVLHSYNDKTKIEMVQNRLADQQKT